MRRLFEKKRKLSQNSTEKHLFYQSLIDSINHLRDQNSHIHAKINHVDHNTHKFKANHDQNMQNIKEWLEYFNSKHENHEKNTKELMKLTSYLKEMVKEAQKIDEDYIKRIIDNYITIPQIDKDELKRELIEELEKIKQDFIKNYRLIVKNSQVMPVNNVNNDYNVNNATRYNENNVPDTLTRSEKKVLNILYGSTVPISYADIADKTGHSPNTIKVYINALKKKGFPLEEHNAPNGTKLYIISNKEKVKKFYNFE